MKTKRWKNVLKGCRTWKTVKVGIDIRKREAHRKQADWVETRHDSKNTYAKFFDNADVCVIQEKKSV